jgi:hypothetical protein
VANSRSKVLDQALGLVERRYTRIYRPPTNGPSRSLACSRPANDRPAFVGQQTLDRDTSAGDTGRRRPARVGVAKPRVVVDRDVHMLPLSRRLRRGRPTPSTRLPGSHEAPQQFRVAVQQLARPFALIAAGAAGRTWQPRAALEAQDLAVCRERIGRSPANQNGPCGRRSVAPPPGKGVASRPPPSASSAGLGLGRLAAGPGRTLGRAHPCFDQGHDLAARLRREPLPSRSLHNVGHPGLLQGPKGVLTPQPFGTAR